MSILFIIFVHYAQKLHYLLCFIFQCKKMKQKNKGEN